MIICQRPLRLTGKDKDNLVTQEIFKDIEGYEGLYQISNLGRVYGVVRGDYKKSVCKNSSGYHQFNLSRNSKVKSFRVHRLVAIHFVEGRTEDRNQVNHIDGDKSNNRADNLEWATAEENTRHAYETGLIDPLSGEECHYSKLTKAEVRGIRKLAKYFSYSHREIAETYNVSRSAIQKVISGESWRNV